ncbi:putative serine/threonine-protein kinase nek1 [Arapaima gigas]
MTEENKKNTAERLKMLTEIKHPHIVEYKESFEEGISLSVINIKQANLYIVMENCIYGDLAAKIESNKQHKSKFSEAQILKWFSQICLGLKHARDNGLVHQDIKPQMFHCFLQPRNTALFMFCFSVISRKDVYAKIQPGMPIYVSPEVWKGKPFSEKSDIWALGCVLYELCTLSLAVSITEVYSYASYARYEPVVLHISSRMNTHLITELLQREPEKRPSVDDVLRKPFIAQQLSETFNKLHRLYIDDLQKLVGEVEKVADSLERVHFRSTVASLTGGVVGAAGGITSVVGFVLAPFTLGASLIVTGIGIGVAVAGGVTSAASNITNMTNQSAERKNVERIIHEYQEKMEPVIMSLDDISFNIENLQKHQKNLSSPNDVLKIGCRAGRGLGGIAELVRLVQVARIGRVAAQAARAVHVAEAFTGVLAGVFILLDVIFIYKDSKEIHNLRIANTQTTEETDIQSAVIKVKQ